MVVMLNVGVKWTLSYKLTSLVYHFFVKICDNLAPKKGLDNLMLWSFGKTNIHHVHILACVPMHNKNAPHSSKNLQALVRAHVNDLATSRNITSALQGPSQFATTTFIAWKTMSHRYDNNVIDEFDFKQENIDFSEYQLSSISFANSSTSILFHAFKYKLYVFYT